MGILGREIESIAGHVLSACLFTQGRSWHGMHARSLARSLAGRSADKLRAAGQDVLAIITSIHRCFIYARPHALSLSLSLLSETLSRRALAFPSRLATSSRSLSPSQPLIEVPLSQNRVLPVDLDPLDILLQPSQPAEESDGISVPFPRDCPPSLPPSLAHRPRHITDAGKARHEIGSQGLSHALSPYPSRWPESSHLGPADCRLHLKAETVRSHQPVVSAQSKQVHPERAP